MRAKKQSTLMIAAGRADENIHRRRLLSFQSFFPNHPLVKAAFLKWSQDADPKYGDWVDSGDRETQTRKIRSYRVPAKFIASLNADSKGVRTASSLSPCL